MSDSETDAPEWKVTYEGGFYPKRGREGKEIRIDKTFNWGKEIWHIPAVYLCSNGMVVDFCKGTYMACIVFDEWIFA